MQLRRLLCGLIVLTLVTPEQVLAALASSSSHVQAQDDRAERERKNNADKAAKKAAEQTKDYADNLKEIQPELDEFAASLLDARYADPFLQDYVNELGQSLVPKEVRPGTLFAFRVLDNPEPNAFALPDGRIYINTGLLLFAQNEAQLAVVLGHEIAHVTEQHYVESVKAQRREQVVSGVLGAVSGAIVGALTLGKKGVVDGAVLGAAAGIVVATVRMNNYNRRQEDEADSVGTMLALDRKYDAREGVAFFKKLMDTYGDQGRFANALYGKHSRNKDRMSYIDQLVTGNLGPKYNELRSSGSLTTGTGQMQMYTSRMIRDVSIYLMDYHDQYAVAKEHLERIADYRASDPRTLWALGRVYKLVGRTDADKARALDYLQRAATLDERNGYPYIHRDLGLMQARLGATPAAVESLKKYVLNHVQKYHEYPLDLEETYDYLLAFGDRNWTAPGLDPRMIRAVYPSAAQPSEPKAADAAAMPLQAPAKPATAKPDIKKPATHKPGGEDRR